MAEPLTDAHQELRERLADVDRNGRASNYMPYDFADAVLALLDESTLHALLGQTAAEAPR